MGLDGMGSRRGKGNRALAAGLSVDRDAVCGDNRTAM